MSTNGATPVFSAPAFPPQAPAWGGLGSHVGSSWSAPPLPSGDSQWGHGVSWSGGQQTGGHHEAPPQPPPYDRASFGNQRSRSPKGHRHGHRHRRHAPKMERPEMLNSMAPQVLAAAVQSALGAANFGVFLEACMCSITPETFKAAWAKMPKEVRCVVWEPPPDVVVDWKSIGDPEKR